MFAAVQVEGVIYSIPKRIFNDSAVFSDMYDLPQDPCHPADGVDEAHPLKLDGTKKTDFENFLRLFISYVAHTDALYQSIIVSPVGNRHLSSALQLCRRTPGCPSYT
jgi:hypothetical protein